MNENTTEVPHHDSDLAHAVANFCRRDFVPPASGVRAALPSDALWQQVAAVGTELWLDTGDVEAIRELWTREFTALTTNNTLLNKEVQKGIYDELVPRAAAMLRQADADLPEHRLVLEIAFILNAVHGLRLVRTFDADVSVELHTAVSGDTEASYRYGKRFAAIEPDRFIVKVPLTPDGLVAARRLSDDGVRVNFTLGFSARQNHLIARVARPTWVNVFMGRLNSFVADNGLGDGENVGEKATLSSQRAVRELRRHGSRTRQIGASIRSGAQVRDLVGVDVLTIPTGAAAEFRALEPPPTSIVDRTADDPEVQLSATADAGGIAVFWEIDERLRSAADALAALPASELGGERVRAVLRDHGAGDLFPSFGVEQQRRIAADGKIPVHETWRDVVASGAASWDGMLTAAGLSSFATDQAKLDARIGKFLGH